MAPGPATKQLSNGQTVEMTGRRLPNGGRWGCTVCGTGQQHGVYAVPGEPQQVQDKRIQLVKAGKNGLFEVLDGEMEKTGR